MNVIDREFNNLVNEIRQLSEKELYYRIRKSFDAISDETKKSCIDFFNKFGYWGKIDINTGNYEQIELKCDMFYNHIDDFIWLYNCLGDYRSKYTLFSILSNFYRYDFANTYRSREYMYDDYFDLDLIKCDSNEVIVDLGAYTGDTVLSYIRNYGEDCYKKIYCYEITEDTFEMLKNNLEPYENIECRLKGISNEEGVMDIDNNIESSSANRLISNENGKISVTTLDKDIDEKITLIKSDIEGFEQKMIEGAKNHIINDHPKLLISVYHNNEDLWKIPKMIYEMNNDYKFYLRFNSSPIYPTEITLIAI